MQLDAAYVMKAALSASGQRTRADRQQTDTVDAVMLAAACLGDDAAMDAVAENRRRSDVRAAVKWIAEKFASPTSAASRRVERYAGGPEGAQWAVDVAQRFGEALASRR